MKRLPKLLSRAMVAAALLTPMLSNAANVTIQVLKSDGSPYPGIAHIRYAYYGYNMGSTNANGELNYEVADGTYEFKVTALGTSKSVVAAVTGDVTLTFYTSALNATVQSCSATPIAGVGVKHAAGIYQYHFPSYTSAAGQTTQELFPGTYDVTASFNGTSETKSVTVSGNGFTAGAASSVVFNPTTVTLGNTGGKTYKAGAYSYHANGTIYMFPGTYEFTFPGAYKTDLTIGGCAQNMTVNILVLKDNNNNPLSGGTARGGSGANFSTFHVAGSTNANGVLFDVRSNASTTMSYEMRYNTTTAVLTQTSNNLYTYQTNEVKLKLETCNGTPISGGTSRFGHGSVATNSYFPGGATNASGETVGQFFPGTYSFEMNTNSSAEVKSSVVIPNANTTLTWKTTAVTLNWPYSISYGGAGDSRFFNGPTMELLPCTLNFNFRAPGSNNYTPVTISGCSMSLTPGIVKLKNSENAPLAGGSVDGYQGGWSTYGTTGANGNLLVIGQNPSSIKMNYNGGGVQLNGINFAVNPIVSFQTQLVTMEFKDASGAPLESSNISYYGSGWGPFASGATIDGSARMEMMPSTYSFKLAYKGASQQITSQNIITNPIVTFQTALATVHLKDASDNPIAGGIATFYAGSWQSLGTTDANGDVSTELLPVNYSFRMIYAGKSLQKDGVGIASTVNFTYNGSSLVRMAQNGEIENIAEEVAIQNVELYPNPASNSLNVKFYSATEKTVSVQLLDITGKVVMQSNFNAQQGNNMHTINVSDLSAGNYMLKFEGIAVDVQKVVVQH